MGDLDQNLKNEFLDEDYRYAYAESFLNTKLATQIKTLREQRIKTQAEVAAKMGIKQPGYRRFEDVNHSVWKTDSLWSIARAYGVRVNISFETFGSLLDEKKRFTKEALQRPEFEDDPIFNKHEQQSAAATLPLPHAMEALNESLAQTSEQLSRVWTTAAESLKLQNVMPDLDAAYRNLSQLVSTDLQSLSEQVYQILIADSGIQQGESDEPKRQAEVIDISMYRNQPVSVEMPQETFQPKRIANGR